MTEQNSSCELLSKHSIFDIRNNSTTEYEYYRKVVNCSQNIVSLILETTIISTYVIGTEL